MSNNHGYRPPRQVKTSTKGIKSRPAGQGKGVKKQPKRRRTQRKGKQ